MAGRWSVGSIAGVTLVDSASRNMRVDVLDGEGLKSAFVGSSVLALDFTVHTQLASHGVKGVHFGCHIALLTIAKLNAIVAAIETAAGNSSAFAVALADASGSDKADNFTVNCVVDYQANGGKVFQRGALSNIYVKDVIFRFLSVS